MQDRLRNHVDTLFAQAPALPRVYEFKEELLANLAEKYEDLVAAGVDEQQAYDTVVAGIGDVDSLIQILANEPPPHEAAIRQQTAQVVSTAVFLYCAALAALFFVTQWLSGAMALVVFFLIAGLATAQLVYHFMTCPTVPSPAIAQQIKARRKKMQALLQSSLWLITTALYFIISFSFGNWHISWIIFLIAPVVSQLINLFSEGGEPH